LIAEITETTLTNTAVELGQLSFSIEEPIKVEKDKKVTLTTVTLRLREKPKQKNQWLELLGFAHCSLLAQEEAVTGRINQPDKKYLEEAKSPETSGFVKITSENQYGEKDPGNTLTIDFRNLVNAFDRTKYLTLKGEVLHVRILRSTDGKNWEELSGEAPYAGNLKNIAYVYEDKELDDGTQYYYKIFVSDLLGNEKETALLSAVPKDLTPPGEVTSLRGLAEKNRFLLKWQNPNDLDLGGIVIIRNENYPIAPKALTTGKEYYPGDLPFGQEKGEVVYASFQEDFDPAMVEAEFIDDYVEPDIEYYYNIYTYDRDLPYSPKEMGRNYSKGLTIVMTTAGQIMTSTVGNTLAIEQALQQGVKLNGTPLVFPNPFNPTGNNTVTFQYSLNKNASIDLIVTDLSLRVLKKISIYEGENGGKIGSNKVVWDGRDDQGILPSNGPLLVSILVKGENRIIGKMRVTVYRR